MIKENFNYAERLRNQLKAMSYNPIYEYIADASHDLMKKKRIDLSDENIYIDFETYNDIMISAGLFKLVGKTPGNLSIVSRQILNNCKSKIKYNGKKAYIYLGNNQEIYISLHYDKGNFEICMDEPIQSDYGEKNKIFNGNNFFLYDSLSKGYNYISCIFDTQNDNENITDFSDYPKEFETEFLKQDIFESNDEEYESEWIFLESDRDFEWYDEEYKKENQNG